MIIGTPVALVGTAAAAPELRFTTGGAAVSSFSLAVNRKDKEGNESTSWYRVSAWNTLGENAAASISKGDRVVVWGTIEVNPYETKEGAKGTSVDVTAEALGPDLRWAQAVVTKNDKNVSSGAGQSKPSQRRGADPVYGDEEPF